VLLDPSDLASQRKEVLLPPPYHTNGGVFLFLFIHLINNPVLFTSSAVTKESFDKYIPLYILWYMNTKTILNIKTDKSLKKAAQDTAEELGVPLGTAINAFLKQFVREKELTLSASRLTPTPYLQRILKAADAEYARGEALGPFSGEELIARLKRL